MEEFFGNKKLPLTCSERNKIVSREETVLDIPAIIVVKAVDIHVPLPVVVPVHVDNRDLCDGPPEPPPFEILANDLRVESNSASLYAIAPSHQLFHFLRAKI